MLKRTKNPHLWTRFASYRRRLLLRPANTMGDKTRLVSTGQAWVGLSVGRASTTNARNESTTIQFYSSHQRERRSRAAVKVRCSFRVGFFGLEQPSARAAHIQHRFLLSRRRKLCSSRVSAAAAAAAAATATFSLGHVFCSLLRPFEIEAGCSKPMDRAISSGLKNLCCDLSRQLLGGYLHAM